MIETKKTKQFYSINNAVATNTTNIQRMEYNFNNSTLTNIQTSSGQKCIFTPISLTLDWDYKNISESLKNNRLYFDFNTAGYSDTVFKIADNSYTPLSLCEYLNDALNETIANGGVRADLVNNAEQPSLAWLAEFDPIRNKILIRYTATFAVQGTAPTVSIETYFLVGNVRYNATRWMGTTVGSSKTPSQTAQQVAANGAFTNPPTNIYPPNTVDFRTIDTIRIHSNIAKRFFEITGGKLSGNNVLFELVAPASTVGSTLVWENHTPELYSQEVHSNYDNLTLELKDRNGNLIDFFDQCNFNMTFSIEREIEMPDPRERLKNLQNLNQLSSV
jgi:hypothetical protein